MTDRPDRLLWFIHFRKAGGSSITELAARNGERLHEPHVNGNPLDEHRQMLRLWELSESGLDRFVDDCRARGTTFIATEWGMPDLATLARRPDVKVVAIIRDPVERMASNFVYDRLNGETRARDVVGYGGNRCHAHTQFNYYTRMLLREHWRIDMPAEEALDRAEEALSLMDSVVLLDEPDPIGAVAEIASWDIHDAHLNKSTMSRAQRARRALVLIKLGRPDLARRVMRPPVVSEQDKAALTQLNTLDVALYRKLRQRLAPAVPSRESR